MLARAYGAGVSSRDFLERLRPSATPGAATRAGVPADRVAERSAELEPLLALLADVQAEAERIRAEARDEAGRRNRAAAEQARALVAEARRAAQAERQQTAAAARAAALTEAQARLAAAHAEAEQVDARAAERIPGLVDRVVRASRARVAEVLGVST